MNKSEEENANSTPSFEVAFKAVVRSNSEPSGIVDQFWLEIEQRYSKKGRYYHTLTHLHNLYAHLLAVKEKISDWPVLLLSIAYHDVIYNVLKSDNEEKSAQFAKVRMAKLSLTPDRQEQCVAQIIATKSHTFAKDGDTNYFTDADLAILGSAEEEYIEYSKLIRKEYKIYPDFVYNPGRQKVLQHFLQMPQIYKTKYFRDKFEEQARINLENELNS